MRTSITRPIAKVAAGFVAVATITTGVAAEASATATRTQHYWDDCADVHCTRYYSVEQTEELYEQSQHWSWATMRTLSSLSSLWAVVTQKDQVVYGGYESALNDAVNDGACLQFQWRIDGKGRGKWSSTKHPGYCFVESYADSDGNVFYYDPETNTYSAHF
ncbi:hypothetical protein MX572_23715 (plasmid) [Rhodococcus pyridinivorans]|uniref:hypothetical protein n=1 Tax=Rhodococcus pyridinivorans TaxID=103816 RepID=UPI0020C6F611|nr:hypothetical protein [Rhodococcus pyridinivorans]UTM39726.1 hypothetical protein MX572_23715 [Rhodococcus pyridinivorans]